MKFITLIITAVVLNLQPAFGQNTETSAVPQAVPQHAVIQLKCVPTLDHYTFNQLSAKLVPGVAQRSNKAQMQEGDFLIVILDDKKNPADTVLVSQPLNQVSPKTAMVKGKDAKDTCESQISFNYLPNMKYMLIYKVEKDLQLKGIGFLPLEF